MRIRKRPSDSSTDGPLRAAVVVQLPAALKRPNTGEGKPKKKIPETPTAQVSGTREVHQCNQCTVPFERAYNLQRHVALTHTVDQNLKGGGAGGGIPLDSSIIMTGSPASEPPPPEPTPSTSGTGSIAPARILRSHSKPQTQKPTLTKSPSPLPLPFYASELHPHKRYTFGLNKPIYNLIKEYRESTGTCRAKLKQKRKVPYIRKVSRKPKLKRLKKKKISNPIEVQILSPTSSQRDLNPKIIGPNDKLVNVGLGKIKMEVDDIPPGEIKLERVDPDEADASGTVAIYPAASFVEEEFEIDTNGYYEVNSGPLPPQLMAPTHDLINPAPAPEIVPCTPNYVKIEEVDLDKELLRDVHAVDPDEVDASGTVAIYPAASFVEEELETIEAAYIPAPVNLLIAPNDNLMGSSSMVIPTHEIPAEQYERTPGALVESEFNFAELIEPKDEPMDFVPMETSSCEISIPNTIEQVDLTSSDQVTIDSLMVEANKQLKNELDKAEEIIKNLEKKVKEQESTMDEKTLTIVSLAQQIVSIKEEFNAKLVEKELAIHELKEPFNPQQKEPSTAAQDSFEVASVKPFQDILDMSTANIDKLQKGIRLEKCSKYVTWQRDKYLIKTLTTGGYEDKKIEYKNWKSEYASTFRKLELNLSEWVCSASTENFFENYPKLISELGPHITTLVLCDIGQIPLELTSQCVQFLNTFPNLKELKLTVCFGKSITSTFFSFLTNLNVNPSISSIILVFDARDTSFASDLLTRLGTQIPNLEILITGIYTVQDFNKQFTEFGNLHTVKYECNLCPDIDDEFSQFTQFYLQNPDKFPKLFLLSMNKLLWYQYNHPHEYELDILKNRLAQFSPTLFGLTICDYDDDLWLPDHDWPELIDLRISSYHNCSFEILKKCPKLKRLEFMNINWDSSIYYEHSTFDEPLLNKEYFSSSNELELLIFSFVKRRHLYEPLLDKLIPQMKFFFPNAKIKVSGEY